MVAIWRRGNIGKCRGKKYFARAKGDVRQKWSGGYAPPMADLWAKNISPVQKVMYGRNGQVVTRHQWPTSGRKIFRPYKWMIGDAKRFAHVWTGIVPRCGNRAHFWFAALDTVRSFT